MRLGVEMVQKLEALFNEFENALKTKNNQADILNLKSEYLGKKGFVSNILKSLKDVSAEERKTIGPKANKIKEKIQSQINEKLYEIELNEINEKLEKNKIDISFRESMLASGKQSGGFHPRTLIQREIEDVFLSMGFEVLDGPHIEDEFHNFEALNIPPEHPARAMHDTFYVGSPDSDLILS